MEPKISIVTPSFNQGKYLEETICSILNQNYANLEYIIIDGGSTDQSVEIIKKYSSQLTYWKSEKDTGQSDAINKGLKIATGEIVTWICSDDLLAENALNKVAEIFVSLPISTGVVHGNTQLFTDKKILNIDKGYAVQNIERRLSGMAFPQPSAFIRKTFLDKVGLLDTNYHYGMDYDLFSRLSVLSDFHYADELFSKYRLHKDSKSQSSHFGFADDWKNIFNTIVAGLNLVYSKHELEICELLSVKANQSVNFFEPFRNKLKLDEKLLCYYFLSNILKYDYQSSNFARSKKIAAHLRLEYHNYLLQDEAVHLITKRLDLYPAFFISAARKLKQNLTG